MDSKKRPAEEDIELPPAKKQTIVVAREPSIFGIKPTDDITKYIADFIAQHVTLENVEASSGSLSLLPNCFQCPPPPSS